MAPRTDSGWELLAKRHRNRIARVRRTITREQAKGWGNRIHRAPQYLADVDRITGECEKAIADMPNGGTPREQAIRWEQAVAELILLAHQYWKQPGNYCATGWNVFNTALGSKRTIMRDWAVTLYFTGPAAMNAEDSTLLNQVMGKLLGQGLVIIPKATAHPERTRTTVQYGRDTIWTFPLSTGEVKPPVEEADMK